MSDAAVPATDNQNGSNAHPQSTRETVESVVVAFILAFLFRAFVAEAFVIPTGSMAPTLMGAHKDLFCEHCGQQYQASASSEFDSSSGAVTGNKTIASTCSNCRGINAYDFKNNPNHASFSGDRILVSKFDYVLSKPERWDVFVFKFPLEARMNYIKRLVGLPGEALRISEGDVYTRTNESDPWVIARKPPHKIKAMRQVVSDTDHRATELVKQGWPSLWQPWGVNTAGAGIGQSSWTITNDAENWSASLRPSPQAESIRYYHKFVDVQDWENIEQGGQLPTVDPYTSTLITDYVAYNSSYTINATDAFEMKTRAMFNLPLPASFRKYGYWQPKPEIDSDFRALDYVTNLGARINRGNDENNDGYHWVGDLAGEYSVSIESDSGTLSFDLVEYGVRFQCTIDIATGKATLQALDQGQPLPIFDGEAALTADTSVRGAGSYRLELANFDDHIVLWINGAVVPFDQPATFDSAQFRNSEESRRPFWSSEDPLDAAPLGIGGTNISMTVDRAQVYRDIYYIAINGSRNPFSDYDLSLGNYRNFSKAVPDAATRAGLRSPDQVIEAVYGNPQWWDRSDLFMQRQTMEFQLEDDQYFPMGDNSAASSDARAWYGHNFVEEKYLLGKALLVFWPHTWNSPIPFTPNVRRMGPIR